MDLSGLWADKVQQVVIEFARQLLLPWRTLGTQSAGETKVDNDNEQFLKSMVTCYALRDAIAIEIEHKLTYYSGLLVQKLVPTQLRCNLLSNGVR